MPLPDPNAVYGYGEDFTNLWFVSHNQDGTLKSSLTAIFNVATAPYSAVGNGVADDTTPLQTAIDAASSAGGGIVFLPRGTYKVTGLTLKNGVKLVSYGTHYGYAGGTANFTAKITCATASATVIDTPVGAIYTPAVEGITIDGGGVASIGIRYRATQWGAVKNVHLNNFLDQGLKVDAGNAGTFRDILAINGLQTRARGAVAGVIEIAGADHRVEAIEATASLGALTDSNAYLKAFLISQTNGFHSGLIGEISDGGIYVSGNYNRFSNCRADLDWGHGWEITGANNTFASCHGVGCGRQTANTYDHFKVSGTGNSFAACRSRHTGGATVKYGFEDTVAQSGVATRNSYDETCGGDGATAPFIAATYVGSGRLMPPHDVHPAAGTTQIDVTGTSLVSTDLYSGPATVTDFLGGVHGQSVSVFGSANVTIAHNGPGNIRTNTGANKVLVGSRFYRFTYYNALWYEDA